MIDLNSSMTWLMRIFSRSLKREVVRTQKEPWPRAIELTHETFILLSGRWYWDYVHSSINSRILHSVLYVVIYVDVLIIANSKMPIFRCQTYYRSDNYYAIILSPPMLSSATGLLRIEINQQMIFSNLTRQTHVHVIVSERYQFQLFIDIVITGMSCATCIRKVSHQIQLFPVEIKLQQDEDVPHLFRSIICCCLR